MIVFKVIIIWSNVRFKILWRGFLWNLNIFDSWYRKENTVDSLQEAIENSRAIVIITEHSDLLASLKKMDIASSGIEVIVDGRNCLDPELVDSWNILYRGIGRRSATDGRSTSD